MNNQPKISYAPGVCNINPAEVAYRRKASIGGYVIAIIVFVALSALGVNVWLRAAVTLLPLFVGVIGTLQVRNKFCVSYAASGKQNATEGSEVASVVEGADQRSADKRKARQMNTQAAAITLVILILSLLIPRSW